MLSLLGLIPGVLTAITTVTGALFDARVKIIQARTGATRDVVVQALQAGTLDNHETTARLGIIAASKVLVVLFAAMMLPLAIYEWQVIVGDILWCHRWMHHDLIDKNACDTEPIKGQVAEWANAIIYSMFGSATTLAVSKMWLGRKQD